MDINTWLWYLWRSFFDHVVPLRTASINQRRQLKTLFCERSGKNKTVIYWDVGKKQLSLKEWMSKCGVSNKKSQLLMCCGVFIFPVYICWSINASSKQNSSLQMGIEPLKTMVILIVNKGSLNGQNSWCEWITITEVRNVLKQLHRPFMWTPEVELKKESGIWLLSPSNSLIILTCRGSSVNIDNIKSVYCEIWLPDLKILFISSYQLCKQKVFSNVQNITSVVFHSMNCLCIWTEQNVRCHVLYIKLEHMFAVETSDPLKLQTVVKEADMAAVRNI